MTEPEMQLPPWPKKRRVKAAGIMTGFILIAALCIGIGVYQIGLTSGSIKPPLTKRTIMNALAKDASFIHAVDLASKQKECVNQKKRFWLQYRAPLHVLASAPADELCQHFVALHPTGADVFIDIQPMADSWEHAMQTFSKEYEYVQADTVSGTHYMIGRLTGLRHGVPTTTYTIGTQISSCWILAYSPTSPTLNNIVQDMVVSFTAD